MVAFHELSALAACNRDGENLGIAVSNLISFSKSGHLSRFDA